MPEKRMLWMIYKLQRQVRHISQKLAPEDRLPSDDEMDDIAPMHSTGPSKPHMSRNGLCSSSQPMASHYQQSMPLPLQQSPLPFMFGQPSQQPSTQQPHIDLLGSSPSPQQMSPLAWSMTPMQMMQMMMQMFSPTPISLSTQSNPLPLSAAPPSLSASGMTTDNIRKPLKDHCDPAYRKGVHNREVGSKLKGQSSTQCTQPDQTQTPTQQTPSEKRMERMASKMQRQAYNYSVSTVDVATIAADSFSLHVWPAVTKSIVATASYWFAWIIIISSADVALCLSDNTDVADATDANDDADAADDADATYTTETVDTSMSRLKG
uniref:Uncharacterized protein n=1 Tax=Cannabis sativa TaxID=3483 RepID=A0A803QTV1_CANSA